MDLYQAHRYDHETPLEETMRAFDDLVRAGKVLYIGVSEWRAEQIAAALRMAGELGLDRIVSNQPQYNMLWRVIEPEVVPLCEKEGIGQIVFSPIAQGVLTGKYEPGTPPPAESRATDADGFGFIERLAQATTRSPRCSGSGRWPTRPGCRWPSWRWRGRCRTRTCPRPSSAPPGPSRCGRTSRRPGSRWTPG